MSGRWQPTRRDLAAKVRTNRVQLTGNSGGDVVVSGAISGLIRHVHGVAVRVTAMSGGGPVLDASFPAVRVIARNSGGTYTTLDKKRLALGMPHSGLSQIAIASGFSLATRVNLDMQFELGSDDPESDYYQLEVGEQLMVELVDNADAVVAGASGLVQASAKFSDE